MSTGRIGPWFALVTLGSCLAALTGCAFSGGSGNTLGPTFATATTGLGGKVYGGQQPIVGAAVTLWSAGTSGTYGTGATSLATATTGANGAFSFNTGGVSPCTPGQSLYITSLGGNPGGGNNPYAALMAALPAPCSAGSAGTAGLFVFVDEVTTVASVTALQQFMSINPGGSPAWTIGAPAANTTGMANAFLQVGNLVSLATGNSGVATSSSTIAGITYTTTITPDSTKLNTLADILASCINTAGNSTCTSLLTDTTPLGAAAPADTLQAAYYLASNAGGLNLPAHGASQGEPFYLCSQYIVGSPPFLPYGNCGSGSSTYPTDWAIGVSWTTGNGTIVTGTATPYNLAIDGLGNIWTAYGCSGSTACTDTLSDRNTGPAYITEFNPQGQVQFTPVASTTISTGPSYPGYTGSKSYSLIAGRPFSLAIDTANNAWFDSFYGATPATLEGVVTKVAPGGASTGYLIAGSTPGALAIDGNDNIYLVSVSATGRYYLTELEYNSGTYATFDAGIGRATSLYNGIWADSQGYAWSGNGSCTTPDTVLRANTADMEAASVADQVTNEIACPYYPGAADPTGGAFFANGSLYHMAIGGSGASLSAPVTVTEAAGTGTSNGGLDGGNGVTVDGLGNVWVANNAGGVSEFAYNGSFTPLSPSGTATVPVYGFGSSYLNGTHPVNVATDASGNVWIGTQTTSLWYLVGIAGPTVTPTSAMLAGASIGTRPGARIQVSLSPALNFSTVVSSSAALAATLSNTGNASVNLGTPAIGGTSQSDFTVSGTTCGATLAIGASCSITVSFVSSAAGTFSAALTVPSNAAGSPASVALTGAAATVVGTLSLNAGTSVAPLVPSIAFPTVLAGQTSTPEAVVLTNTGSVPLTLAQATGGTGASQFSRATSCGSALAAGASCDILYTFEANTAGSYSASLTLTDNAGSGSQTIALSGTAQNPAPAVQFSTPSLSFSTAAGSTSAALPLTVTNSGSAALTFTGIGLSGTDPGSFTQSSNCAGGLSAGASCTVSIAFSPATTGTYTAALSVADNASGSPQSVSLAGTAPTNPVPQISLSASSLSFTQLAETVSAAQTVTVTDTGAQPLMLSSVQIAGTNAFNFTQTNACPASILPDGSCAIAVTFNPSLAAAFSASLALTSNAASNPNLTVALNGTGTGTLSINTSNPTDWVISNGAITLDWDSTGDGTSGHVFGVHLTGFPDNLADTTNQNAGLYMDNAGTLGPGVVTSGYTQVGNTYIDWWVQNASNSTTNAFTTAEHFIITANDTGFHAYTTADHGAGDIYGQLGAWGGYTFRINLNDFLNYYIVNEGLYNLGVQEVPLPATAEINSADVGRDVQNAVVDLHGWSLPVGFSRQFFTKYDYSTFDYLHKAHGLYGPTYGAWAVYPQAEWQVGGPSKQGLIFTEQILSSEGLTSHLDNNLIYTAQAGAAMNREFGPVYFHFNTFNTTNLTTPDALYAESQQYQPGFNFLYDMDPLLQAGGRALSTVRGTVAPTIANGGSATANVAWTVLEDNATNFQYGVYGPEYWVNQNAMGTAPLTGVAPGTYRLSSYVLGQWGELRQDNVVVNANQTTSVTANFVPENFSSYAPIWTIGTPDRSAHEFLHGHDASGNDLRNFYGAYNFWQDFASTSGTQTYYATAVGSTPATNNPNAINYTQWGYFDPPLYGGYYNAADDTTDGYNYIVPAYVAALPGATGTQGETTPLPPLTIHFTTTAAQLAQGQYTVLSVALACTENDVFATLNGQTQLIWHSLNPSDCMVRSGLAGYYQWIAFQWNTSALNAAGADNVLKLSSNQLQGFSWDALRMEIANTSASPSVTGWHDYEFLYGSTYVPANDALPNP